MSLHGKRINKKQAMILEELFQTFDAIHAEVDEYGREHIDMTDTSDSIVSDVDRLYVAFGKSEKHLFNLED